MVIHGAGLPPEDVLLSVGLAAPASAPDAFTLRLPDGRTLATTEYSLRWGAGTLTFPVLPGEYRVSFAEIAVRVPGPWR